MSDTLEAMKIEARGLRLELYEEDNLFWLEEPGYPGHLIRCRNLDEVRRVFDALHANDAKRAGRLN
jgi:hypothetical protein